MHNRDLIWTTSDGRKFKIKDMSSTHLNNTLNHIEKNINVYLNKFGINMIKNLKFNIKQEIRFRKLNRLKLSIEENDLF